MHDWQEKNRIVSFSERSVKELSEKMNEWFIANTDDVNSDQFYICDVTVYGSEGMHNGVIRYKKDVEIS